MQPTDESTIKIGRKVLVAFLFLPLFPSFAGIVYFLDNPRFHDIRSVDMVRPTGIGACWGVAIAALALLIASKFSKG